MAVTRPKLDLRRSVAEVGFVRQRTVVLIRISSSPSTKLTRLPVMVYVHRMELVAKGATAKSW